MPTTPSKTSRDAAREIVLFMAASGDLSAARENFVNGPMSFTARTDTFTDGLARIIDKHKEPTYG